MPCVLPSLRFFYFSPCQLCFYQVIFSFISSQVLISISFFCPTRFSWSFVPKPTSISLLTRCYIIPDSWTSQMSTFVEFNVVLVHLWAPQKKKVHKTFPGKKIGSLLRWRGRISREGQNLSYTFWPHPPSGPSSARATCDANSNARHIACTPTKSDWETGLRNSFSQWISNRFTA